MSIATIAIYDPQDQFALQPAKILGRPPTYIYLDGQRIQLRDAYLECHVYKTAQKHLFRDALDRSGVYVDCYNVERHLSRRPPEPRCSEPVVSMRCGGPLLNGLVTRRHGYSEARV